MRKKPNSTKKLFRLDNDVIKIIVEGAEMNNMNQTEFIEFLTNNYVDNYSAEKRLENIEIEKIAVEKKKYKLQKEEKKLQKEIEMMTNWKVTKLEEKEVIVKNLVRVLNERRFTDAEHISRLQGTRLGIPALELLTEALNKTNGKK